MPYHFKGPGGVFPPTTAPMDREQRQQVQRAGRYGYEWGEEHAAELRRLPGRPEVWDFLSRSPEFVRGLPRCPMGSDPCQQLVQFGRLHRAAVAGVLRSIERG